MKDLEKRITAEAFFLGLIFALTSLIFGQKMIAWGIWAGSLISILNFKLLVKDVEGRLSAGKARFRKFFINFPLRYGIMAAVLWFAISKDFYFFIGMAIGLFVVRLAIYIDVFLVKRYAGYRNNSN